MVRVVEQLPGPIACSSLSKPEIVVPVFHNNEVIGVLDADSAELNKYDTIDQHYLEEIIRMIDFNI